MWFIGEWWNDASSDNFAYLFGLLNDWKLFNFNQLIALFLMAWGAWRIAHIIPSPLSDWIITIGEWVIDWRDDTLKFVRIKVKQLRKWQKSR